MPRPRSPRGRARETVLRLAREYPGSPKALCALRHDGPFQLTVATILSAQTTDERVNLVTPGLFAAYPTPEALAGADLAHVEELIHQTGFFRNKARSVVGMAQALVERFDGRVPTEMEDLVSLPGVGRKTANVIRSVALGLPGLPVDTHVGRVARRLGLTDETDPVRAETALCALLPAADWGAFSLRVILHGRPRCPECVLQDFCPSAGVPVAPPSRTKRERTGAPGR